VKTDRIRPFRIEVAQEVLSDLRRRLKNTRFSHAEGANWAFGTDIDYLRDFVRYWHDTYDWRKHETALNRFAHFRTEVDDIGLHFIHERAEKVRIRFRSFLHMAILIRFIASPK